MNAYTVEPPTQWQAGLSGKNQTPFYFDCARCGAKEPKIAGFIGSEPDFQHVAILRTSDGFYKTAMYCEACWLKELAERGEAV